MIKNTSFITIPSFAVTELHLKGNELLLFGIIYGFSQDGSSWFEGSRTYLAEWLQASKSTVDANLAKLIERGLVVKRVRVENGVRMCSYAVARDLSRRTGNDSTPAPESGATHPEIRCGGAPESGATHPEIRCGGAPDFGHKKIEGKDRETIGGKRGGAQRTRFTPPTPQEVADYAAEKGLALDADRFCDHYTANGWKVGGRSPMKDWRAAVRNWCRNYSDWAKPLHAPEARKGTEYDGDF